MTQSTAEGLTQIEMDDGTWPIDVHIEQQAEGSWTMPVELHLESESGGTEVMVADSGDGTVVTTLCQNHPVDTVQFDPRNRILYADAARDDTAFWPESIICGTVDGDTSVRNHR